MVSPTPSINTDSLIVTSSTCGNNDGSIIGLTTSNGTPPYTYNWMDSSSSSIGANIDLTNIGSGSYTLILTDINGCTATTGFITISDNIGALSISTQGDTTICFDDSTIISANGTGGAAPYTYFWDNGLSGITTHTISPSSTTTYIVYAIDSNGCQTSNDTIIVAVNPLPNVNFTAFSSGPNATFSNSTTGAATYLWNFDDGNTSTEQDPSHSFTNNGTYNVCLTATSAENCGATICKDINITITGVNHINVASQPYIYPNPSKNGQFNITFSNTNFREDALFLVYNMQGVIVYQKNMSDLLQNQKIILSTQSEGIYFYKITDLRNAFNGKLTIIK